ncbi:hypothetical protein TNCV_2887231 [Trichonephila clavipes]|nr:hypothetical protein TNCV_2887231 [Trichonephila clavipes]
MYMTYNLTNRLERLPPLTEGIMMVNGSKPRPIQEQMVLTCSQFVRNSQFFGENNQKKHLTVEIIRIIRLSRERDEALGQGPVGPCFKTSLHRF